VHGVTRRIAERGTRNNSDDAADARAIAALLAGPQPEPVERSLTGLAYEVRAEFVEAQRKRSWGR